MDEKEPIDTDIKNVKLIYNVFKHLNETQASDERLWVGLALSEGYEYMKYRWGIDNETKIKYRWLYHTHGKRALFYQGISRLWWYGYLSYDDSRLNPYELTEFAFGNQEIIEGLMFRSYSNSRNVSLAILSALFHFEQDGGVVNRSLIRELYKDISFLGGISIIDAYERKELEDLVYVKMFEL